MPRSSDLSETPTQPASGQGGGAEPAMPASGRRAFLARAALVSAGGLAASAIAGGPAGAETAGRAPVGPEIAGPEIAGAETVAQWGVVGNGKADDTAALNAALAACSGRLLLLPGSWVRVTGQITLPKNVTLDLNGARILYDANADEKADQIVLRQGAVLRNGTLAVAEGRKVKRFVSLGDRSTAEHLRILSVDAQENDATARDGALRIAGNGARVFRCAFRNWRLNVKFSRNDVSDCWIDACEFDDFATGISMYASGLSDIRLTNLLFGDALELPQAPGRNAINGGARDLLISDVHVKDAREHGIYLSANNREEMTNVTLRDVTVKKSGRCGFKIRHAENLLMANCHAQAAAAYSKAGKNEDGFRLEKCGEVQMTGCSVSSGAKGLSCHDGVFLNGCGEVRISDLTLERPARAGIYIENGDQPGGPLRVHGLAMWGNADGSPIPVPLLHGNIAHDQGPIRVTNAMVQDVDVAPFRFESQGGRFRGDIRLQGVAVNARGGLIDDRAGGVVTAHAVTTL